MRKRHGENLIQDKVSSNWAPGETPLIIRQFNKSDFTHKILPIQANIHTNQDYSSETMSIRNQKQDQCIGFNRY